MSNFSSSKINEIHVINKLYDSKRNEYIKQCPIEKNMFYEYYIFEIDKTINGKLNKYRFEIDKILCEDKVLREKFNHS